jgi:Rieske Fe-S protein
MNEAWHVRLIMVARGIGVMLVVMGALAGCEVKKEKAAVITAGVVNLGPAGDFPAGDANTNFVARYGIVVTNASGTPLAIRPVCTHVGGVVKGGAAVAKWNPSIDQFECSAHACRWDLLGRVTKGPATEPLPGVAARREGDGTLTVDLSRLYGR